MSTTYDKHIAIRRTWHGMRTRRADSAYMRSGRYRWIIAQNASPLFHDVVKLVIATSRYPSHWRRHHSCNARTLAAITAQLLHPTNCIRSHVDPFNNITQLEKAARCRASVAQCEVSAYDRHIDWSSSKLIINFELLQKSICPRYINVTDGQTDERTTYDSNTALALRASRGKNRICHVQLRTHIEQMYWF